MTDRDPRRLQTSPTVIDRTRGRGVTIYLLHFDPPLTSGAGHYLGAVYAGNLTKRLQKHAAGHGARLTAHAKTAGTSVSLVRTWTNQTWTSEKALKSAGHFARHCPLCTPHLQKFHPPPYSRLVAASKPKPDRGFKSFS